MLLSSHLSWVWVGVISTFKVVSLSVLIHSDSTKDKSLFQEEKSGGSKTRGSRLSK